jgi:uncharacterized membrane protein
MTLQALPSIRHPRLAFALVGLALGLALPAVALGSVADEQREGAQLFQQVQSGAKTCSQLSTANFERIGEYVMGQMVGSTSAHEAMNSAMQRMMGTQGEEQMHVLLGRRMSGCGGGTAPSSYSTMMGLMGGFASGGGMMGGDNANGSGSHHNGWSTAGIIAAVLAGLLLLGLLTVALTGRLGRGEPETPLDLLRARYARGEIDQAEFDQRRHALGDT